MHLEYPILTHRPLNKRTSSYLLLNKVTDICLTGNKSQTNKKTIHICHYQVITGSKEGEGGLGL